MYVRSLSAALISLLLAPACTLDLDRDDDPVFGAPDAPDGGGDPGWPDAGPSGCWDRSCAPDGGIDPDPRDAGVEPDRDGGTPACDAGRPPFPHDGGTPPERDGGSDPWPDAGDWPVPGDAGVPTDRDGGGWPVPPDGGLPPDRADAGSAPDCRWISDEAVCIVTPACVAWYEGIDCVCDDDGACECVEWVYSHCE